MANCKKFVTMKQLFINIWWKCVTHVDVQTLSEIFQDIDIYVFLFILKNAIHQLIENIISGKFWSVYRAIVFFSQLACVSTARIATFSQQLGRFNEIRSMSAMKTDEIWIIVIANRFSAIVRNAGAFRKSVEIGQRDRPRRVRYETRPYKMHTHASSLHIAKALYRGRVRNVQISHT